MDTRTSGLRTMSITHTFRAHHAVASDPRLQQPHEHEWSLTVEIAGEEVGPGWVMDFADLRSRCASMLPNGADLNGFTGESDATAERVLDRVVATLELPNHATMVRVSLSEAPGNAVHWRAP